MAIIYGIRHSFSIFFSPILAEFNWPRGSTAIMLSLNLLFYGLLAPVAGSLGDRWKPRVAVTAGILTISLVRRSSPRIKVRGRLSPRPPSL